ncbi:MAG TPA: hypothetical protein VN851_21545, partial [Thermoanaerobaculia bacterium]|nr:hypothetical protein [Thermoanaerobaculia bacterium]
ARVSKGSGDYVAWLEGPDGEIQVAVAATYPNPPLAANAFIEKHDPAEVFLAVASPRRALPAALVRGAKARITDNGPTRQRLRQENAVALADFPGHLPEIEAQVTGCSASFRTWAGSVFGDPTCGQSGLAVIDTVFPTDSYCTSGCDYQLGASDKGSCTPALQSCDIVRGQATVVRLRTTTKGTPVLDHDGHRAHFGVANCSGNGPVQFSRKRNATTTTVGVVVNGMLHYPQGTSIIPALAKDFVAYGSWQDGTPPSGATYLANRMWVDDNDGTDDRVIACGDIQTRYDMSDISAPSCHGANISLCTGGNCDSPCFHCVGGTCN